MEYEVESTLNKARVAVSDWLQSIERAHDDEAYFRVTVTVDKISPRFVKAYKYVVRAPDGGYHVTEGYFREGRCVLQYPGYLIIGRVEGHFIDVLE